MDEVKKIGELNKTEKAAIVLQALQAQGFKDADIARLTNVSRTRVHDVNKKLKAGTLNPLVNKAKKAVKQILEGKKVGDMNEVRGSDVLTAAKMVLDRSDPITVKTENTHVSYSYELKDEDRSRYKKALGIIDAEYEVLPEGQKLIEGSTNGRPTGFEPADGSSTLPPSTNNYEQGSDEATDSTGEAVQDTGESSSHNQHEESASIQEVR